MKLLLTLAIVLVSQISFALDYVPPSKDIPKQLLSKTLLEIGTISELHIFPPATPQLELTFEKLLKTLNNILEKSKISLWKDKSVAHGIPPTFEIKYSNGITVKGDRYTALISVPDMPEVVLCALLPPNTAEQDAAANP